MVTAVVGGEFLAPEPGDPGDPGEPGFSEADGGGLERLVLVDPEKESLKLGFCLPDKLDFPNTSFSSGSFTGSRDEEDKYKSDLFILNQVCTYFNFIVRDRLLSLEGNKFLFINIL